MSQPGAALQLSYCDFSKHRLQFGIAAKDASRIAFKFNPAFVETIEHNHARRGVFHALGREQLFPGFAWHDLGRHRAIKQLGKGGCNVVGWQ